jgi:predicted DCC family thiol-disulfide oxidoreductase YuxK
MAGFLMKTPPTSWLAKIVYRWIARNRHRLPGGAKECSIQDNYLAGS